MIMKLQCAPSPHPYTLFSQALGLTVWALDYIFFGTITYVEEAIRRLLETAQWTRNPIRFLLLDFSLVPGVDLSAAEAFVRVQRSLASKGVTLVLCGFAMDSPIALALQSVELFEGQNVEVFSDINQAIEWTENVFLKAWFDSVSDAEPEANAISESRMLCCSVILTLKGFFCAPSFSWTTKVHPGGQRIILGKLAPKETYSYRRRSDHASSNATSSAPKPFAILFCPVITLRQPAATSTPRGTNTDVDEDVLGL